MKRMAIFSGFAAGAAALAFFAQKAPAVQLTVPNPSFEQRDPQNPDQPLGYSPVKNNAVNGVLWDQRAAHTGRASLYVRNDSPENALWQLTGGLDIVPGLKYKVSIWIKTREATGYSGVSVRYRAGNQWLNAPLGLGDGEEANTNWHQSTITIEPPDNANSVSLFFGNGQGQGGEVWFDDLSVTSALDSEVSERLPAMMQKNDALLNQPDDGTPTGRTRRSQADQWRRRAGDFQRRAAHPGGSKEELTSLSKEWAALNSEYEETQRLGATNNTVREWSQKIPGQAGKPVPYVAGWENSVTRVWLRDIANSLQISPVGHIDAARGETEAIQLGVMAVNAPLNDVRVNVGDLAGATGRIAGAVTLHPVGSVKIEQPNTAGRQVIERDYRGWWPDILLNNFAFDVAQGDTVPVWISVTIPRNAQPGIYTAPVDIAPANAAPVRLNLEVQVWNVDLPAQWHFRNIMSFNLDFAKDFYEEQWSPELRQKFLEFLTARRINLTTLYKENFTWDEISRALYAGQNTVVVDAIPPNVALVPGAKVQLAPAEQAKVNKALDDWVPRLRQLGWLDRALFYGFDEVHSRKEFETAQHVLGAIKQRYPGLQTISTMKDSTYGLQTGLTGVVDNFVPQMPFYDPQTAAQARQRGTNVWWYTTDWNMEQPLSRSRLIPWMTAKVGVDGFEIWVINRWRGEGGGSGQNPRPRSQWATNNQLVQNQILNAWNPALDGKSTNSTGCYLYPGVNGPLSSLRLENFRDGIEEYDLLEAGRQRLNALRQKGGNAAKIQQLSAALQIEDNFIADGDKADYRPEAVLFHRQRLLQALAATAQ